MQNKAKIGFGNKPGKQLVYKLRKEIGKLILNNKMEIPQSLIILKLQKYFNNITLIM